jgi:hypothetical protein
VIGYKLMLDNTDAVRYNKYKLCFVFETKNIERTC